MMHSKWRMGFALVLILSGAFLLFTEIFRWRIDLEDVVDTLWPTVLIVIGGYLIWRQWRWRHRKPGARVFNKAFGDLDFSGSDFEVDGLDAGLGFGDLRIDLTQADFSEKEHRVHAHVGIGDIKVILPQDIPVRAHGNSGIGDIHLMEKTAGGLGSAATLESEGYRDATRKIYLKTSAGIGDITVTRAEAG
jgi:predicted membrane protein